MKHLKRYNESSSGLITNNEIDDVKDLFQDIIDEYNLEKVPQGGILPYGLSYQIYLYTTHPRLPVDTNIHIEIYVNDMFNRPTSNDKDKYLKIFHQKMIDDLENFCQRLESIGFTIEKSKPKSIHSTTTGPFEIIIKK